MTKRLGEKPYEFLQCYRSVCMQSFGARLHRVRSLTRRASMKIITFLKIIDYADIMHSYDLVPIAVETLGLSSSDTLTFLKQLWEHK